MHFFTSKAFIHSLVYAGIIANGLGALVCLMFGEFERIPAESLSVAIYCSLYLLHKRMGTW